MHTYSMRDRKQQKNIYLNYLWGHSIGIIFLYCTNFIFYHPPLSGKFAFLLSQKKSFCMIYKLVSSWGPIKCPHKVKIYWYYYLCGDIWSSWSDKSAQHTHACTHRTWFYQVRVPCSCINIFVDPGTTLLLTNQIWRTSLSFL